VFEQRAASSSAIDADVEALHRRCGVYTRDSVVRTLLDAVGWTSNSNLADKSLLEPATGDGAFVVTAASRLLDSLKTNGIALTPASLAERITAFEIHPIEADRARSRVVAVLEEHGYSAVDAYCLSRQWIQTGDFLTEDLPDQSFTHVVGNPPYSRWSRIPAVLRERYEAALPRRMARGDLFLPFLDLGIGALKMGGRLGFVCSDRWRYMAFAEVTCPRSLVHAL
jgi:adenine-specific DNA-methyltransferase